MVRAIIFAHYDVDGDIDPHVTFLLSKLKEHASILIFVSTSASAEALNRIRGVYADIAVARENVGYDFLSWKVGYYMLEEKDSYDEVLFINDSVYGPLSDLGKLFQRMRPYSFWGLVRNHEIQPHIQSFCYAFSRDLIQCGAVDAFWSDVKIVGEKHDLIREYEVGLTQHVRRYLPDDKVGFLFDQTALDLLGRVESAFSCGASLTPSGWKLIRDFIKGRKRNPTHFYWRAALEAGVPFVKVELLRSNPCSIELDKVYRYLNECSSYPVDLIVRHLSRVGQEELNGESA